MMHLCKITSRSNMAKELWIWHRFWLCVHCDLDLADKTLGEGHDISLGYGQQLCVLLPRSNMEVRSYGLDKDFVY